MARDIDHRARDKRQYLRDGFDTRRLYPVWELRPILKSFRVELLV